MKPLLAAALLFALTGCESKPPATPPVQIQSGFSTSEPAFSGYLDFKVDFTHPLSAGRTLKIASESRPWWLVYDNDDEYRKVSFTDSMLQKPNGEWIVFDCNRIADRIIDKALVIEITPLCTEGHKLSLDYWKQHNYTPDEFTDSQGVKWVRAK